VCLNAAFGWGNHAFASGSDVVRSGRPQGPHKYLSCAHPFLLQTGGRLLLGHRATGGTSVREVLDWRETSVPAGATVHGRFVFAFSTGENGLLSDLCLVTSNMGDTPDTLRCVVDRFRGLNAVLLPNLKNETWVVTWILEP